MNCCQEQRFVEFKCTRSAPWAGRSSDLRWLEERTAAEEYKNMCRLLPSSGYPRHEAWAVRADGVVVQHRALHDSSSPIQRKHVARACPESPPLASKLTPVPGRNPNPPIEASAHKKSPARFARNFENSLGRFMPSQHPTSVAGDRRHDLATLTSATWRAE